MNRQSRLPRSAEGQRAWEERTRERARERAQAPRRRRTGKKKVIVPKPVRQIAINRSLGVCVVCLHRAGVDPDRVSIAALQRLVSRGVVRAAVQVHHVLPEQSYPELVKCSDNLVGVCTDCHYAHEYAPNQRIPRAALPSCCLELALDHGEMPYIERIYPLAAAA
jgi:hypothetical protein